jgi:hypothetical protein
MPSLVPTLPAGVMSDAQELKKGTTFSSSLNEKIDKVEEEKFFVIIPLQAIDIKLDTIPKWS